MLTASGRARHVKVLAAQPATAQLPTGQPGQVVVDQEAIFVLTGDDGALKLDQIQLAGKKAMSAGDFVRGRTDFAGAVLGD